MNFNLMYYHKIDPRTFDDMFPYEREIYISMLVKKIEEEIEKEKQRQSARRARGASKR